MEPPSGVTAAPNQSEIRAKVLQVEQSPAFSDKWYLDLEILASKSISGPDFAREGQQARGFTFESVSEISAGSIITAQAEYLGDARGGQFQLTEIETAASD